MKVALVSFSNNYDMQENLYSMQSEMRGEVITIGSSDLITNYKLGCENYIMEVPNRPLIEIRTFNIVTLLRIRKILITKKIDKIVFLSAHTWNYILIKILPKRIKKIHIIHDVITHEGEKNANASEFYNKLIIRNIDEIIVHSKGAINLIRDTYNVRDKMIYYLPVWRNFIKYTETKDSKCCTFFGRINPYKGITTVLNLAATNPGITFNVVGKVSKEMLYILDDVAKHKNINIINRYVSEEELKKAFYDSDIIILPYESATQSGVIIDAYRHSRPVIAYDVGSLSEQIEDKVSGYLVQAKDFNHFNECLIKYINKSKEEKSEICNNAWNFGCNYFSVEKVAVEFTKILKN